MNRQTRQKQTYLVTLEIRNLPIIQHLKSLTFKFLHIKIHKQKYSKYGNNTNCRHSNIFPTYYYTWQISVT